MAVFGIGAHPKARRQLLRHRSKRQKGSLLIELSIALAVVMLLTVYGARQLYTQHRSVYLQTVANWLAPVREALVLYMLAYDSQLAEPSAKIVKVQDKYRPTLQELKVLGLLRQQHPDTQASQRLLIELRPVSSAETCDPSLHLCERELWLFLQGEAKNNREIHDWQRYSDAKGAYVLYGQNQHVLAADIQLENRTPLSGIPLQAGSVGYFVGANRFTSDFLRVKDTRNPDFQADVSVKKRVVVGEGAKLSGPLLLEDRTPTGGRCVEVGALSLNRSATGLNMCGPNKRWQRFGYGSVGGYTRLSDGSCVYSYVRHSGLPECHCPVGYEESLITIMGDVATGMYQSFICQPQ